MSRALEAAGNAGQSFVGLLLAGCGGGRGLLVVLAASATAIFAFAWNSLCDRREDRARDGAEPPARDLALVLRIAAASFVVGLLLVLLARSAALLAGLALGVAYSAPLSRLKERAGLECVANGLAHALPFIAGYAAARPMDGLAWLYGGSFFCLGAGFYLLHCIDHREPDRRAGIRNLVALLGPRASAVLSGALSAGAGLLAWAAATRAPALWPVVALDAAGIGAAAVILRRPRVIEALRWVARVVGVTVAALLLALGPAQ